MFFSHDNNVITTLFNHHQGPTVYTHINAQHGYGLLTGLNHVELGQHELNNNELGQNEQH